MREDESGVCATSLKWWFDLPRVCSSYKTFMEACLPELDKAPSTFTAFLLAGGNKTLRQCAI